MAIFENDELNDRHAKHEKWTFAFGDKIQNMCAGERNPMRTGIFVKRYRQGGRLNNGTWITMTDGKGNFGDFMAEAIEPLGWEPTGAKDGAQGQTT